MNDEQLDIQVAADVITFVDEAGARGYVRALTPDRDHEISVLSALPVPKMQVDTCRQLLQPAFDRFAAAAPAGGKLHITDAFSSGNDTWAAVATEVRQEVVDILLQCQFRVVYAARRLRFAREGFERSKALKEDANARVSDTTRARYRIHSSNRPSDEQVDNQVMIDLTLLLDEFIAIENYQLTDLHFDEIDRPVARRYADIIERTRTISHSTKTVTARDMETQTNVSREINFSTSPEFDTTRVGQIVVAGKTDPLVFAADIVANSLWRHLSTRDPHATLNDAVAVAGWDFEPITFYNREGEPSPFDRF